MRRTVTAYAIWLAALIAGCVACGGGPGSANDTTGLASQAGRWQPPDTATRALDTARVARPK